MSRSDDKDLFEESTMTFGEHLEELRGCLFRSLTGLAIGFVVGLYFGGDVVAFIQTPLTEALEGYYQAQSTKDILDRLEQLREAGYPVPDDLDPDDPDEVAAFVTKVTQDKNLILEEIYINPRDLLNQLRKADPKQFANLPETAADSEELSDTGTLERVFIWRPLEKDSRVQTKALNAHEAFVIYIKASLLVGALLSCPWIFYQIWSFVAAGLYGHERRFVHTFLPFSLSLFFAGAALAFCYVFEPVLKFLLLRSSATHRQVPPMPIDLRWQ